MRAGADRTFVVVVLLLALAVRMDFLSASNFTIDADEAIVGLMARHINEGQAVPAFYYGQHYMGSLEALLVSGVFKLVGATPQALKSIPLVFSLWLVILVYELGCTLGGQRAGRWAAILAALPPSALVIWSAMARGGFIELVVIGTVALLLTARWLKNADPGVQPRLSLTAAVGAVLGLGWWVNNQIVYFMGPIGFMMLLRLWQGRPWKQSMWGSAQHALTGVLFFLLGGAPFWLYNWQHHWISFEMFGRANGADVLEHLQGVFTVALPILFGAKRFWQTEDVFSGSSLVFVLLYGVLLCLFLMWRLPALRRLVRLRLDTQSPVELIFLCLLSAVTVFSLSTFGWLVQAPRYLLPIYPVVFVMLGLAIDFLWARSRMLAAMLGLSLLGLNLASCYLGGRAIPGEPFVALGERVSKDHHDLVSWLKQEQVRFVHTNYWIGYRLAFETAEQVRFLVFQEPHQTRIPAYREEGSQLPLEATPYVLVPSQAGLVREALHTLGYSFQETSRSGYAILYDIKPTQDRLLPFGAGQIRAQASHNVSAAGLAFDGRRDTRWGSAAPQRPGMTFTVSLAAETVLRGLSLDLGGWTHDFPRGLAIMLRRDDGAVQELLSPAQWEAVRYFIEGDPLLQFYFQPTPVRSVELLQTQSDPVFDWSIAELGLYQ